MLCKLERITTSKTYIIMTSNCEMTPHRKVNRTEYIYLIKNMYEINQDQIGDATNTHDKG